MLHWAKIRTSCVFLANQCQQCWSPLAYRLLRNTVCCRNYYCCPTYLWSHVYLLGPLFCDMNARRAIFMQCFDFSSRFQLYEQDALSYTSAWKRICGIQLKLIQVICGFVKSLQSWYTVLHQTMSLSTKCCQLFNSTEEALSIQHGCSVANCSHTKESAFLSDMLGVVLHFIVNEICLEYEACDPDNKDLVTSSMCHPRAQDFPLRKRLHHYRLRN